MGDERISGAAKKVRGSITEALGKLTGDKAVENRGAAQKREAEEELKASASRKENPNSSVTRNAEPVTNNRDGDLDGSEI